jgi:hypothetical protein
MSCALQTMTLARSWYSPNSVASTVDLCRCALAHPCFQAERLADVEDDDGET